MPLTQHTLMDLFFFFLTSAVLKFLPTIEYVVV